jgi:hypothetical protein
MVKNNSRSNENDDITEEIVISDTDFGTDYSDLEKIEFSEVNPSENYEEQQEEEGGTLTNPKPLPWNSNNFSGNNKPKELIMFNKPFTFQGKRLPITCETAGVAGAIVGGFSGAVVGIVSGVAVNYQHFGKQGFVRTVAGTGALNAANFALWLGSFSYVKCSLAKYRGQRDAINSFTAGFVAGSLTALRLRDPRRIIINGLISATLAAAINPA